MKRSRKQAARERLTVEQVRLRDVRKAAEADRAYWLLKGGEVEWQAELNRRRAARNARVRAHVAAVVTARRASQEQPGLWDAA